ncbi:hypothetical protein HU765_03450 [Pseudomonas sp. SWRI81]|uniref:hypothetical protein n=1 Tax=Pseudomonas sp. SWRI81 TaxID=2745505 RepID=UPI0016480709|nr:hypothetical protein [Pseudomonas sp. SWRI81]MBC3268969.1 hypothetical protein [Pseudomonas sp. SWRI81]
MPCSSARTLWSTGPPAGSRWINTRPLLLKDAQGRHYLHVFDGWMMAERFDGDYQRLVAAEHTGAEKLHKMF